MSAALSQPDAARFTIFIDHAIEAPRFNFLAFCRAARISAAEALTWLNRADIKTALQSCMDVIQLSARIRHAVLDTNAMGTLGQILKTSENQVELRRVATTIISRHKADLRTTRRGGTNPGGTNPRGTGPGGTGLPTGVSSDSASRATGLSSSQCESPSPTSEISNLKSASHSATPPLRHFATSSSSPSALTTQHSALLRALDLETRLLRRTPSPREPHSARTLLTRVGSARSRDHP